MRFSGRLVATLAWGSIAAMLIILTVVVYGSDTLAATMQSRLVAEVESPNRVVGATPTPNGYDIHPLSEVYSDGAPEVINITSTHATLSFVSSIPLACAVVYGKSSEFGMIAVDQDMNGGAHTDHAPLMSGLEPDTEYVYRVQGSAADGIIYVDQENTFRTPPAESSNEVNLASLAAGAEVIGVSSNFGNAANDQTWGANSAIDENPASAWSSAGDGNEAFIEVRLAEAGTPHAVEVWSRSMSDGSAQMTQFRLTTNTGQQLGPFTLPDTTQAHRFEVNVTDTIQSLRLEVVESTGGNTGLVEFSVYARNQSANYLPITIIE
ncbi:MAG: hypothetical protein ACPGWR_27775 [Ardenticatenaceae bacterium]